MKTAYELILEACGPGSTINHNAHRIDLPGTLITGPCCVGPFAEEEIEIDLTPPTPAQAESLKILILDAVMVEVERAFRKRGDKDG